MTRAAALAKLAAATLKQGSLVEYEPGDRLIVDHLICDVPCIVLRKEEGGGDEYVFEAAPFCRELNSDVKAWAYLVDPNA